MFRLILEASVTLSIALIWLVQVESFGYLFRQIATKLKILGRKKNKLSSESNTKHNLDSLSESILETIENLALGALTYATFLFALGLVGLIYKDVVLWSTLIIFILINIISKRWITSIKRFNYKIKLAYCRENIWSISGFLAFFAIASITTFRPVTQFDGVWYHLSIPKLYLLDHSVEYLGLGTRYSVHPMLNQFWNLWPMSLPFGTPFNSVILNWFQTCLIGLSLYYTTQVAKQVFEWSKPIQFLAPLLLGITAVNFFWFGAGYNDLFGYGFSLIVTLYIIRKSTKENSKITLSEFVIGLGLILVLSLVKLQMAVVGSLLYLYMVFKFYPKLHDYQPWPALNRFEKINQKLSKFLAIDFIVEFPKFSRIIGTTAIMTLIFAVPLIIRSFYYTRSLFFPAGIEWFTEDTLNLIKAGTIQNYWHIFAWNRFGEMFVSLLTYSQTPLFGIGALAILSKQVREKLSELWLIGVMGFLLVFFLAMVGELRYNQASNAIIIFIGLCVVNWFTLTQSIFSKIFTYFTLIIFIPVAIFNAFGTDGLYDRLYIRSRKNMDDYIYSILGPANKFSYILNQKSIRPSDLGKDEKIFVHGVNNLSYIDQPLLSTYSKVPEYFYGRSFEEFLQLLRDQQIRYVIIGESNLSELCNYMKLKDSYVCETETASIRLTKVLNDPNENVKWYKIQNN